MINQLLLTQNVQISIIFLSVKYIVIRIKKWYHVSLTSNQIAQVGGVLKLSEPADSKTDPGFENCPRFEGVIEQNKIQ